MTLVSLQNSMIEKAREQLTCAFAVSNDLCGRMRTGAAPNCGGDVISVMSRTCASTWCQPRQPGAHFAKHWPKIHKAGPHWNKGS